MIHLDTSFLIRALVVGSLEDQTLRRWLTQGEEFAMSAVAWAEFLCGPVSGGHLQAAAVLVSNPVPFDETAAVRAASLFNTTGRRRGSFADCMIAATALELEATIATANPADFEPFQASGLAVTKA